MRDTVPFDDADISQVLDARQLSCPLPVYKAKTYLDKLSSGELLKVIATDKNTLADFCAFTESSGHKLLSSETIREPVCEDAEAEKKAKKATEYVFVIQKH